MNFGDTVIVDIADMYEKKKLVGGKINVKVKLNYEHIWYGIDRCPGKVFRLKSLTKINRGI